MKNIFLIISVIVLFSCNNKTNTIRNTSESHISTTISNSGFMKQISSDLTKIDAENCIEIDGFELSNRVKDLRYIYLKTEEPVGYVSKAIIHKNRIIIADYMITEKIFIFDMDGNLIKIISDKGGGPKEYRSLGYMDSHNEEIIVTDGQSLKRLYYTLNGEYVQHEKCLPCNAFALIGDMFILHLSYHQSFTYKVTPNLVIEMKDSAVRRALPYHNIQKETTPGNFSYNYKGDLLFTPSISDTVYQILTDSTFTSKYVVKHKKSVWRKYNEELGHGEISQLIRDGYSQLRSEFYETEKNVEFQLVSKMENTNDIIIKPYWFDKSTKQVYGITPTTINRSEKGLIHPDIIPQAIGVWGNYYIGEIRPEQIAPIMEYQKQNKGTKDTLYFKNEELRKIIQLGEKDPNQVIVLYELDFNK
ncbi:MAG: 6-bladed beta-propeller [Bacteroidales bacterium]|nr:6-bladed beta-propeller [Bacteroidales bacterium]